MIKIMIMIKLWLRSTIFELSIKVAIQFESNGR